MDICDKLLQDPNNTYAYRYNKVTFFTFTANDHAIKLTIKLSTIQWIVNLTDC